MPVPDEAGGEGAACRAVEAVWRTESPVLVARLARMVRDVGLAEDLAQDALLAALERWPRTGVPDNPGAWLMTTARNGAVDALRRRETQGRREAELARDLEASLRAAPEDAVADAAAEDIKDDLLRLVFTCCHPVLSAEARVALTLRTLGGLRTEEIARALLVAPATVGQRISRAKRTLADADVAFEVPGRDERPARLASVLEVVYLVFNEGYAATSGQDWMRTDLQHDALRLGRVLTAIAPAESEVHGLLALMELQASRAAARVGPGGEPVLLEAQDRSRWNRLLVRRGLEGLARARALGDGRGPYTLQAAIAGCHARAHTVRETDWTQITALYDTLLEVVPSPVVALNRAVAISMARGPAEALALVDDLAEAPQLRGYHLLDAVRGDLLARLGRYAAAHAAFERAASQTANEREQALLRGRARAYVTLAGGRATVDRVPPRPRRLRTRVPSASGASADERAPRYGRIGLTRATSTDRSSAVLTGPRGRQHRWLRTRPPRRTTRRSSPWLRDPLAPCTASSASASEPRMR